jgi:hypothetical protein
MRSESSKVSIVLGGLFAAAVARADTPPSFAGQWSATALTAGWSIGDWGDACGPKPGGGSEAAGTVTITQAGGELAISGAGRPFTTSSCWEQLPGITRTSHTASARSWRSTCKSPSGDPRQSTLVTTLTATSNDQLTLDETGQYQFVIKGQNCTASVRRTRYYRRIHSAATNATPLLPPQPTAAPTPKPVSGQAPLPVPKAVAPVCALPGPPARIEVRPSHKLIRAGESFAFEASVLDGRGCRLGVVPSFRLEQAVPNVNVAANGKVSVDEGAAEGKVKVVAAVGSRSVTVTLDVVSKDRYEALLAQGGFDPSGASTDAAVARLESGSVGARSTVVEDDSGGRRTLFVGVVGAAALGLGMVGLLLVRRGRKKAREQAAPSVVALGGPPRSAPGMVCPTCRDEYPPEATFCAKDGNRLQPLQRGTAVGPTGSVCPICGQGYDPGITICPKHDEPLVPSLVYAAGRAPVVETRKICPVCGAQFTGDSQFCGSCGAALVPVN